MTYSYGESPADVAASPGGTVTPDAQFTVWTAAVGGTQITATLNWDGTPNGGVITADALGRVRFKITAHTWPNVWVEDGVGNRWRMTATQALDDVGAIVSQFPNVQASAVEAVGTANSATSTAAAADGRSQTALAVAEQALAASPDAIALNVLLTGAVGDGITDDTAAIQTAVDSLPASGGTILLPRGRTFLLNGAVVLRTGVTVEGTGAAVIKKLASLTTYYAFVTMAKGGTAYGSGGENITIRGIRFKGSFLNGATTGCSITLHKARNVLIEGCHFQEAHVSGHPIDIGGCDGITIRKCVFEGWKPVAEREYSECVGVDWSIMSGNQVDAATPTSYDGAPTINVSVTDCRFVPLTYQVNGVDYGAGNPFGSHSRVQDRWLDNMLFQNNYVAGVPSTALASGSYAPLARGWIHFMQARNVKILNNTFVNLTTSLDQLVIGSQTLNTGILLSDTALVSPTAQSITPLPATDWLIQGNTFTGFKGAAKTENLIAILGRTGGQVRDIRILDNNVNDAHPDTNGDTGCGFVDITQAVGVRVERNHVRSIRSVAYIRNSQTVSVARNEITGGWWGEIFRFDSCTDTALIGNLATGVLGFLYGLTCTRLQVAQNSVQIAATPTVSRSSFVALSGATDFKVADNLFNTAQALTRGIYAYSSSSRGQVNNNIQTGTLTTAVDATGTAVTAAGNI